MKNLVLNGIISYIVATIILIWALYRLALWILIIGKEWISSTASLTVTETELVNELNFYSSGTIPFEEIDETKIVNYKGKSYLLVLLKQPQKFITGRPILKRILLKRAFKKLGAPVVFTNDQIYYDLEKLQTVINSNLNRASE